MNYIKRNWLSILAVILSVTALVRCEPMTVNDSLIGWVIGVSVAIMSFGIVVVLGYQIYNAATIDKRMQEMFDIKTKEVRDDIAVRGARSDSSILYKLKGVELNLYLSQKNYEYALNTLNSMIDDAMIINQQDVVSDVARLIVEVYNIVNRQAPKFLQSNVKSYLLGVALNVQSHLLAADDHAQPLASLINTLDSQTNQKTECSRDEGN